MFRLDRKTALITGAGSGIGAAIAELFAAQGALVCAFDLDGSKARETAQRIQAQGGEAFALEGDVTEELSVSAAFAQFERRCGALDLLVNNAGIAHVGDIEHTSLEDFERVYRVNVRGVFLCAREGVRAMRAAGKGGVIVNLASIAALIGLEERCAYSASKGAVLALTRSIAVDGLAHKIRCNCICPARVHTPFVDGFLAKNYPGREAEMFAKLAAYQPVGRMGRPEEVAQMALYLASPASDFVTGQAFALDGGVLMR